MPPVLKKNIPNQIINERAAYGPFNLKEFFEDIEGARFSASVGFGEGLPKGLICTSDGSLTGIPGQGTIGNYEVTLKVSTDSGEVDASFYLIIKPSNIDSPDYFTKLKAQVWEAVEQRLPIPDLMDFADQPISIMDVYYLLERWGVLTIWDAFNLDAPGEKKLLEDLKGVSEHYVVYDRGSCLVGAPKDLFSHERSLTDGIQTAIAMAREVYNRNWVIELQGFDKFKRAAWVELQHLGDHYGRRAEIINFTPTSNARKLYTMQALESRMVRPDSTS